MCTVTCMYRKNDIIWSLTGHSDLTSRFTFTCVTAVDWVVHGVQHFTSDHTHYFLERMSMPMEMAFDPRASVQAIDVRFTKYLLWYFYQTLVPVVRKVRINAKLNNVGMAVPNHSRNMACNMHNKIL